MINRNRYITSPTYLRLRKFFTKVSYTIFTKTGPFRYKLMMEEETLRYIINNKCSVSRYGDGEFGIMRNLSIGFQKTDNQLADRLREVAQHPIKGHLICLPSALKTLRGLKKESGDFWRGEIGTKYLMWASTFKKHKIVGSTQISRFYMDYVSDLQAKCMVQLWRELWNNRNILIVEGQNTRLGVGNDLFDNALSIKRILCPASNAFSQYDSILQCVKSKVLSGNDVLILIALGPAATVLAYDLAKENIQSIDVGHIDLEYEWFKMKAKSKVNIASKAVNEVGGGLATEQINDKEYSESIIAEIN